MSFGPEAARPRTGKASAVAADPASRSRRREHRRLELTAAAIALIQERGYEGVSVNELAEAAGISVGGMYRHIDSKADLLVMACEGIYGELRERIVDAAAGVTDHPSRLARAIQIYLDACDENRDRILLMYREYRYLPADAKQRYIEREQAIADAFADLVRAGVEAEAFRRCDPRVIAHDIVLLGHLPALKGWAVKDRLPASGLSEHQTDLILASLRRA